MSKRNTSNTAAESAAPPKNNRRKRKKNAVRSDKTDVRPASSGKNTADSAEPSASDASQQGRPPQLRSGFLREAVALTILVVAVLIALSLVTFRPEETTETVALTGKVGAFLADGLLQVFGYASALFVAFLFWMTVWLWLNRSLRLRPVDGMGAFGVVIGSAVLMQLFIQPGEHLWQAGGVVGALLVSALSPLLGVVGLTLLSLLVLLLSVTLAAGLRPKQVVQGASRAMLWLGRWIARGLRGGMTRLNEIRARRAEAKAEALAEETETEAPPEPQTPSTGEPDIVSSSYVPLTDEDSEEPEENETVDGLALREGDAVVVIRKRKRGEPEEGTPGMEAIPEVDSDEDSHGSEDGTFTPGEPVALSNERAKKSSPVLNEDVSASADELTATSNGRARPRRKAKKETADSLEIENAAKSMDERELEKQAAQAEKDAQTERKEYELPSLRFLDYKPPENEDLDRERLTANARKLEETLRSFKIDGEVTKIQQGPVITMYEYKPASGIKISKIANLEDDLAMALKALKIRIVAPLPGKGTVGIEVPNDNPQMVYLKEILSQKEFSKAKGKLPMGLGKNIFGRPVVVDMTKMPHMIVAGATGQGKSVAVNNMILSLLYRFDPDDLKFILIDPKMLEFSMYEGIAHLLLPVVTDVKQSSLALGWAVAEMERRYQLLMEWGVKNISNFNGLVKRVERLRGELMNAREKGITYIAKGDENDPNSDAALLEKIVDRPALRKLPYIVVIIDELADLMAQVRADVEVSIARLAAKARAAGIHLILATQRPSTDVITGVIKNNFPARMSLKVTGMQDSRTVIDQKGAEQLLGRGDTLLMMPGQADLLRVQSAYVTEEEIERIVHHIRRQRPPDAKQQEKILESLREAEQEKGADDVTLSGDNLYDQAVNLVCETKNASISMVQRKLRIGYNRAARMIEQMEEEGIVSGSDHQNKRQVFGRPSPT